MRANAVLLLHGFTGTPWELGPLSDALVAAGYAVSAPLLPGHGTTPSDLQRTRFTDWTRAVDQALEELTAAHPRVALVGMSLGALLALDAAARHQHRGQLTGVVTLGAALRLAAVNEAVIALARLAGARMPDWYIPKFLGSDVRRAEVAAENPGYRTNPLRAAREFTPAQTAAREALAALRLPLLAVHGLLDRTAPIAGALELLALAQRSEATLVVLPRSGHLVAVDHERDEVARQVLAFLARAGASRPSF